MKPSGAHPSFLESEEKKAGKQEKQEDEAVWSNTQKIRWPQESRVFCSDPSEASCMDLAVCFSLWMQHRQVSRVKVRRSDLDPAKEEVASRAGDEER